MLREEFSNSSMKISARTGDKGDPIIELLGTHAPTVISYLYIFLQATSRELESHQPILTSIQQLSTQLILHKTTQPEVSRLNDRWATLRQKLGRLRDDLTEKEAVWKEYEEVKMRLFKTLEGQEEIQGIQCRDYAGNSGKLEKQLAVLKVRRFSDHLGIF